MSLNNDTREEVTKKFEEYEGRVDHFYLDTVGRVTVGVGHMIPNRNSVASVPMFIPVKGVPTHMASTQQKQAEYDNVAKQKAGYTADWYEENVPTTLVMRDADIDQLRDDDLNSFYGDLTNIYKKSRGYPDDFDKLPSNVQMALFDMIFNLGPNRIVHTFVQFDKAIKAGDWRKAAEQSNRPQVSRERNQYVKNLFLSAAGSKLILGDFPRLPIA